MGAAAAAVVGTLVATIGRVLMKTLISREPPSPLCAAVGAELKACITFACFARKCSLSFAIFRRPGRNPMALVRIQGGSGGLCARVGGVRASLSLCSDISHFSLTVAMFFCLLSVQ